MKGDQRKSMRLNLKKSLFSFNQSSSQATIVVRVRNMKPELSQKVRPNLEFLNSEYLPEVLTILPRSTAKRANCRFCRFINYCHTKYVTLWSRGSIKPFRIIVSDFNSMNLSTDVGNPPSLRAFLKHRERLHHWGKAHCL